MSVILLLAAAAAAVAPAPPQNAVVMEVPRPAAIVRHPLAAGVHEALAGLSGLRERLDRPELDVGLAPLRFVAERTGRDLPALLSELTAGGLRFETAGVEGGPAALSITAATPELWKETFAAARVWLARTADPVTAAAILHPNPADGTEWDLGELRYRLDGPTLHLAAAGADYAPPASPEPADRLARLELDLAALRAGGALPDSLGPPWSDPNLGAYLGGYADSLQKSGTLSLTLSDSFVADVDSPGLSLTLDYDADADVPGFFLPSGEPLPAPLVLPGAMYAAAWFRDYRTLWESRGDLLTGDQVAALEARDDEIRQQIKVLGADVRPSELITQLGPVWRLVIAGGETGYDVAAVPQLPAAGLAVSLRDPGRFEELATPVLRGVRLVATFGGAKMQPFRERPTPTEPGLSGLRFADGPGADGAGDLARFNAAPCWTIHRDHFVIASTRPLARRIVAALDAEAAAGPTLPAGVTESQRLDPAAFAAALERLGPSASLGFVSDAGLDAGESEAAVAALATALRRLGPVTVTTRRGPGLSLRVDFAPPSVPGPGGTE